MGAQKAVNGAAMPGVDNELGLAAEPDEPDEGIVRVGGLLLDVAGINAQVGCAASLSSALQLGVRHMARACCIA